MRLKCITCEVLARAVYLGASASQHSVDVELVKRGLHIHPAELRNHLQERIDEASREAYDAILLGYGLCGQATAGLTAREKPLVIPKAHDCITLFLGSRERYKEQFENHPGTYWYTQDYLEREDGSGSALAMGSAGPDDLEAEYERYVAKYGKNNADYLMEVMGAWQKHYQRAAYIEMGVGDGSESEQRAREEAERRGWRFEKMAGDLTLIRRLLNGEWEKDFLVVPPGGQVRMSYDEEVIGCAPGGEASDPSKGQDDR